MHNGPSDLFMINDSHCHFFSPAFFAALARQRAACTRRPQTSRTCAASCSGRPRAVPETLGGPVGARAGRERRGSRGADRQRAQRRNVGRGRGRAASGAVRRLLHARPGDRRRDCTRPDRALGELGLRGVCLFPAMHHVPLDDDRTIVSSTRRRMPGTAVFVHCGVLSVGVRREAGTAQPLRSAPRRSARRSRLALSVSAGAVHHSALRRRTLPRGADGGRLVRQHLSRHVELQRLDPLHDRA